MTKRCDKYSLPDYPRREGEDFYQRDRRVEMKTKLCNWEKRYDLATVRVLVLEALRTTRSPSKRAVLQDWLERNKDEDVDIFGRPKPRYAVGDLVRYEDETWVIEQAAYFPPEPALEDVTGMPGAWMYCMRESGSDNTFAVRTRMRCTFEHNIQTNEKER